MGLLYPGALYLLAILPALLIPYLARERPRRVVVSSVLAFRALRGMRGERFGGRPRVSWTFFIELLILALAVVAIAGPYLVRQGNPVAVVLDNSAAMQALTSSGETRFQAARIKAVAAVKSLSGAGDITVYLTAPEPHPEGPAAGAAAAVATLERARALDAPDDPAALASLLSRLNANRRLGRIIIAGYRPLAEPIPSRVTSIVEDQPIANYAIGSFSLSRETFGAAALHGHLTVANFSPSAATLTATISGDGRPIAKANAQVAGGAVASMDFPNLAPAQIYRVDLTPTDAFAIDNVAFATASAVRSVAILFVGPTPGDGRSLSSIPGVAAALRTPEAYTPRDLAESDLAIFEFTAPKELPAVNALLVMPPPGDPIFDFSVVPASRLELTEWPETDPLTEGVNFRLLNVRAGEYFLQHSWMQPVVNGAGGGLILAGQREGRRFVATGFNPFPYLGRQNLAMSILTLNLLSHLAGLGANTSGFHTGQPWPVPAGITTVQPPNGHKIRVAPGELFTDTTTQGSYTLVGAAGNKTLRAVNLADLTASDLESSPPLAPEASPASSRNEPVAAEATSIRTPLTPYALAAIIALIALEALLVYRRGRVAVEL